MRNECNCVCKKLYGKIFRLPFLNFYIRNISLACVWTLTVERHTKCSKNCLNQQKMTVLSSSINISILNICGIRLVLQEMVTNGTLWAYYGTVAQVPSYFKLGM